MILIGFCDLFRKILLKREKAARINQKTAQKQAARFLSPACLGMFEPSKMFFMFLFVMPVNQNANDAQLRLKSEKSTRINQKTAKKQAARFFRLPAWRCLSHQRRFSCFCL